jgi:hypothetical protein
MRPPTLKSSKKRAWSAFSKYVLARDKYKCITCGGKADNAGHFYHNVLDFDEMNINAQCSRENLYLSGNLAVYAEKLLAKYGEKKMKELSARRYKALAGEKRTIEEYLAIEARCQALLDTL